MRARPRTARRPDTQTAIGGRPDASRDVAAVTRTQHSHLCRASLARWDRYGSSEGKPTVDPIGRFNSISAVHAQPQIVSVGCKLHRLLRIRKPVTWPTQA